jgi:hypothetical protein
MYLKMTTINAKKKKSFELEDFSEALNFNLYCFNNLGKKGLEGGRLSIPRRQRHKISGIQGIGILLDPPVTTLQECCLLRILR